MGRNGTKGRGAWIAALCTSLLLTLATPASAVPSYPFKETFGSAQQPSFGTIFAVAVQQSSGDVLVSSSNEGKRTITRWKPNGEPDPFPALGTNAIDAAKGPGGLPCAEEPSSCDANPGNELEGFREAYEHQIAIDESGGITDGNIYVLEAEAKRVSIFAADGHYLGELRKAGTKNMGEPDGLAVDGAGNVYVSDVSRNAIHKFVPTANPPTNTSFTVDFTAVSRPAALAVGDGPSAGSLFVTRRSGGNLEFAGGLFKLKLSDGELQYPIAEGFLTNEGISTISVDPGSGNLFAAYRYGGKKIEEYDASGASSATLVSSTEFPAFVDSVVAVNGASGDIYANEGAKGHLQVLGAIATLPDVTTTAGATGITPTKATVHGTVNPHGQALTECAFEYGGTAAYGSTAPCAESLAEIGSGNSPVAVEADLSGLAPNGSLHHFRLVAKNASDIEVSGSDRTFTTLHTAVTSPPTAIAGTEATLNGTVHPDGGTVSECLFEYGATKAYGATAPCAETSGEIGSGNSPVPVHADLTGLTGGSTYHFRLVATSGNGTDEGKDESLETLDESNVKTTAATAIGGAVATLNGTVDPAGVPVGECLFAYVDAASYEPLALDPYAKGETVPCAESEAEIGSGSSPVAVHADISGLQPRTAYHFRLLAGPTGAAVAGNDEQLLTLGPKLEAEWAASVTVTEATLEAEIDPNGSPTTFHLEWGPASEPYAHSTPEASASKTSVYLSGLEADAAYHYRFVATSNCNLSEPAETCTDTGPEGTFVTYAPTALDADCPNQALRIGPAARLPDCRAYEMVSPIEKNGGDIQTLDSLIGSAVGGRISRARIDQATPGGDKLTYSAQRSFGDAPSGAWSTQYLSARDPQTGWSTRSISPPRNGFSLYYDLGQEMPFRGFTENLCSAWVLEDSDYALAPGAPAGVPNLYRQDNCGGGGYELLTSAAPPGFAPEGKEQGDSGYFPYPQGFSADGSRTVFRSDAALTPDACPTKQIFQVYESVGEGTLRLVSVLPNGEVACTHASAGSYTGRIHSDFRRDSVRHAVSEDASRVYWSDSEESNIGNVIGPGQGPGKIYLRENADQPQSAVSGGECTQPALACTIPVSNSNSIFWDALPDGSAALYTTGTDLYEFDLESQSSEKIAGGVQGLLGASEDLSRVYLVSTANLTGEAENSEGDVAIAGRPNLYLRTKGAGFTFVAGLPSSEMTGSNVGFSPFDPRPSFRGARVSPSGLHAAFTARGNLTAYDNTDLQSGEEDAQVYLYDAQAAELNCVSCNPSGVRPTGRFTIPLATQGNYWTASRIPGWETEHQPSRVLSEDGSRLFFESFDALALSDTNGALDVYEWEAPGSGSCEEESSSFSESNGGCISLISSGESPQEAEFIDASADGRDVFFSTNESLLPQDPGLVDVYDAREGGGFPQPEALAQCEGEACQGTPAPPDDPTPASSSFQGAGNVSEQSAGRKPCAKGKVRKRGRCVSRQGRKHRQRAKHHGRAAR